MDPLRELSVEVMVAQPASATPTLPTLDPSQVGISLANQLGQKYDQSLMEQAVATYGGHYQLEVSGVFLAGSVYQGDNAQLHMSICQSDVSEPCIAGAKGAQTVKLWWLNGHAFLTVPPGSNCFVALANAGARINPLNRVITDMFTFEIDAASTRAQSFTMNTQHGQSFTIPRMS